MNNDPSDLLLEDFFSSLVEGKKKETSSTVIHDKEEEEKKDPVVIQEEKKQSASSSLAVEAAKLFQKKEKGKEETPNAPTSVIREDQQQQQQKKVIPPTIIDEDVPPEYDSALKKNLSEIEGKITSLEKSINNVKKFNKSGAGGGSGEVKFKRLDDVDWSTAKEDRYLSVDVTSGTVLFKEIPKTSSSSSPLSAEEIATAIDNDETAENILINALGIASFDASGVNFIQDTPPALGQEKNIWWNPLTNQIKVYHSDQWEPIATDGGYF